MRIRTLWLPLALLAALGLVGATLVDAGDKGGSPDRLADKAGKGGKGGKGGDKGRNGPEFQGGPGRGPGGPGGRGLNTDDIVDRLMSFDKNKDGKVVKDELPERMQPLIARGDANKDGALDREECRKLAVDLARDGDFRAFDGPGGPGGFGPPGRPGPAGDGFRRVLDDLNLSAKTREKADEVVKAHQESVRKLMDQARAELGQKLKAVLSEQEFKKFNEAQERQPLPPPGAFPPGEAPRPGDLDRRLDELQRQFQRQLDELRREIRR